MSRAPLLLLTVALMGCGAAIGAGTYLGVALGDDDREAPNAVPAASFVKPTLGEALNDRVQIRYLLIDGESDSVSVVVEYSLGGAPFRPASAIDDYGHEGDSGLAASPGGTEHLFVWNSGLDLGDVDRDDVLVRLTPTDEQGGRGASVVSPTFRVLNLRIATFVGGEVLGDLLVGPSSLWLDEPSNTLYVADDLASKVYAVDLGTQALVRVAGNEFKGFDEDDVLATQTSLDEPTAVMLLDGALRIGTAYRVRSVLVSTGFVKTGIGTGEEEFSGDGGVPENAGIEDQVFGLAHDAARNIYFTDEQRLRVLNRQTAPITIAGTTIQPGTLETVGAGASNQPGQWQRIRLDAQGNVYVLDAEGVWVLNTQPTALTVYPGSAAPIAVAPGEVEQVVGGGSSPLASGQLATAVQLGLEECDVVFSQDGARMYVSTQDNRILVVDRSSGQIQILAGAGPAANSGDGGLARVASLHRPRGMALSSAGLLFVACTSAVRVINAGSGPAALGAQMILPGEIATLASSSPGDFLVADDCLAVGASGSVFTMDTTSKALIEVRPDTRERIVVVGGGGSYGGDGGIAVDASSAGYTLAIDPSGNLVFGDKGRLRVVNRQSTSIVVAGVTIQPGHVQTVAGNGDETSSGDGGPASSATLVGPEALAIDPQGNIYLCDENRVRVVNPGMVATVVAGVTVAPGAIETVIGSGSAGSSGDGGDPLAADCEPIGVALDAAGNIYVVDAALVGVRVVNVSSSTLTLYPGGASITVAPKTIQSIAGNGSSGWNGDGLSALTTEFTNPTSLLVRPSGILVCDPGARRLRRIDASSGIVSTLVGTGVAGFNGDAIPLENARLAPELTALDSQGRLYVLDGTRRIRRFPEP